MPLSCCGNHHLVIQWELIVVDAFRICIFSIIKWILFRIFVHRTYEFLSCRNNFESKRGKRMSVKQSGRPIKLDPWKLFYKILATALGTSRLKQQCCWAELWNTQSNPWGSRRSQNSQMELYKHMHGRQNLVEIERFPQVLSPAAHGRN